MKRTSLALILVAISLPFAAIQGRAQGADTVPRTVPAVSAADSALEARTSEVASVLRCPVCQGESLQDSPSELAQQMRAVVKEQLREGKTPDEVKAYFVSKYGEWILLEPTKKGLNMVLWALPVVLIVGGLGLVATLVRRWTKATAARRAGQD